MKPDLRFRKRAPRGHICKRGLLPGMERSPLSYLSRGAQGKYPPVGMEITVYV